MTAQKVLAFRRREFHADSVRQQRPSPEIPGRLLVFPTWDPALDSMMAWAARQDLDTFLHWGGRRTRSKRHIPSGMVEPTIRLELMTC